MKRIDVNELLAGLAEIKDKRRQWGNLRHKLTDILFIILCAIMCGMQDIAEEKLNQYMKELDEIDAAESKPGALTKEDITGMYRLAFTRIWH